MSAVFLALLKANGLPEPEREFRFAPPRRYRFDFCWPQARLALEQEGGVWVAGRHTRGSGFVSDMAKYNLAACLGWRLIRVTPRNLETLDTVALIRQALNPEVEHVRAS